MGTNRTVLKNEVTGATEVIYESRKTSFQFWVTLLAQLTVIAVVVFAAAKFGVVVESKQVIVDELQPPTGVIFTGIEREVKKELVPLQEQAHQMDKSIALIADDVGDIVEDIDEIKTAVKEIAKNGP